MPVSGRPGDQGRRPLPFARLAAVAALPFLAGLTLAQATADTSTPDDTPPVNGAPVDGAATLTLTITNVANADGTVYIALYDEPATFLDSDLKRVGAKAEATGGTMTVHIDNLPPGRYAVATYHDENGNGVFDTGLFGIPLEGFGFTRDPSVVPSLPTFDDSAITVTAPDTNATLKMRYAL